MEVEWLILADSAQVNGGKLYLLGGGWDVLTVNAMFPTQRHMGVATAFRIPWTETNVRHNVELRIVTDDGVEIAKLGGQVEVGRPPGIPVGSDQRAQLAAEFVLNFAKTGVYSIIALIEGEERQRTHFRVVGGVKMEMPGTPK
jgi:hypothetical protein